MWFTVSLALLVAALICCIFTAAKGEGRLPLWVAVLLVVLALLVTHVPNDRGTRISVTKEAATWTCSG